MKENGKNHGNGESKSLEQNKAMSSGLNLRCQRGQIPI